MHCYSKTNYYHFNTHKW